jgi:hypothetical protein
MDGTKNTIAGRYIAAGNIMLAMPKTIYISEVKRKANQYSLRVERPLKLT